MARQSTVNETKRPHSRMAGKKGELNDDRAISQAAQHCLMLEDRHFAAGLNIVNGQLTHRAVAEALGQTWTEPDQILRTSLHLKSA